MFLSLKKKLVESHLFLSDLVQLLRVDSQGMERKLVGNR